MIKFIYGYVFKKKHVIAPLVFHEAYLSSYAVLYKNVLLMLKAYLF